MDRVRSVGICIAAKQVHDDGDRKSAAREHEKKH
jgi:hypothetical protein